MPRRTENQVPGAPAPFAKLCIAIPARLASTRLPEKPLALIGGRTMIARVAERAMELARACEEAGLVRRATVLVATDDERIAHEARSVGAHAFFTDPELVSGTDRVHAAVVQLHEDERPGTDDLVVNVQGDEPFFSVSDVTALVADMARHPQAPLGTLAFRRTSLAQFLTPSVVKVVVDASGNALLFSRAPIPWPRALLGAGGLDWLSAVALGGGQIETDFLHHLGVYAFRGPALEAFARALEPSDLERREGLEQLRALEAGWRIRVVRAEHEPLGIDTVEDLERAREKVAPQN